MGGVMTEGATLSRIRHCLWNETSVHLSLLGESDDRSYFKSPRGTPVDWVWNQIPMKIVTSLQQRDWQERSLRGAMKALDSKLGFLIAPVDQVELPRGSSGVGVLPWGIWS